jgi:hypothetical protein
MAASLLKFPNIQPANPKKKLPTNPPPKYHGNHGSQPRQYARDRNSPSYFQDSFQAVDIPVIFDGSTHRGTVNVDDSSLYGQLFKRDESSPVHWREFSPPPRNSPHAETSVSEEFAIDQPHSIALVGKDGTKITDPAVVDLQVRSARIQPISSLFKYYSFDKLNLEFIIQLLAQWLEQCRPRDAAGSYRMLLLAKDLIRRFLKSSVKVFSSVCVSLVALVGVLFNGYPMFVVKILVLCTARRNTAVRAGCL